MASVLWYLTEDLNLLGRFYRSVGLTTKCALTKVSENVEEDYTLSRTRLDVTNSIIKTIVECVTKNRRRLMYLTDRLKILCCLQGELLARSLVDASLLPLSHCFSLRPNFQC